MVTAAQPGKVAESQLQTRQLDYDREESRVNNVISHGVLRTHQHKFRSEQMETCLFAEMEKERTWCHHTHSQVLQHGKAAEVMTLIVRQASGEACRPDRCG